MVLVKWALFYKLLIVNATKYIQFSRKSTSVVGWNKWASHIFFVSTLAKVLLWWLNLHVMRNSTDFGFDDIFKLNTPSLTLSCRGALLVPFLPFHLHIKPVSTFTLREKVLMWFIYIWTADTVFAVNQKYSFAYF